ncbi:hypothetical protein BRYFOR_08525 [Marvinbryantia formatexigens DSM 14469]|uniref:Uncharacterized protein n=1 Tax=Marvinbryantia formatexigens DSM 14469 TaxID=478749 RepID=C6LIP5_9FIRM|nr:hypothetical protein [Marvinbryantia formatexigens]EET59434.1 hypothetical protein BRYFOR_08525 [Marvinbryantia formatexigens DSM 14469]UWO24084.1 hypothetical protein NQ534_16800 [Marvinbryantia formatexigens DSM 14469]SDG64079.1 hypothetical protein SAMN05660368_02959 [Marvinbryantia formatexigens]
MEGDVLYHHGIKGQKWGIRRFQNKDGSLTAAGRKRRGEGADGGIHPDYQSAHGRKSIKSMSDSELRRRNDRLRMEREYAKLTARQSKGKKIIKTVIATAGTITAAESAYKTYSRVITKALDKIGNLKI